MVAPLLRRLLASRILGWIGTESKIEVREGLKGWTAAFGLIPSSISLFEVVFLFVDATFYSRLHYEYY